MTTEHQRVLDDGISAGDAPFLIAMIGNGDGISWAGTAGDCAPGRPASIDTIFRFYSMTKAVGCTAAMILIDRGMLGLDTRVADFLPEIGDLRVLEGFDGSTPRLRAPRRPITVQHLATHTSGLAYESPGGDLQKYFDITLELSYFSRKRAGLSHPLLYDPGEGWSYGPSIDWLGLLVEKVDGRPIDQFCQDEIFGPLGMVDTCFELDEAREQRLSRLYIRGADGAFEERDGHMLFTGPDRPREGKRGDEDYYGMGGCLYGTAPDYMRLLRMHLNGGALDGTRIVSEPLMRSLQKNLIGDIKTGYDWFPGTRKNHAFSYMRVAEDMPGRRAAGSCYWAGGANGHYWIDFASDLVGIFVTYDAPFLDPQLMARYDDFERQVYASLRGS